MLSWVWLPKKSKVNSFVSLVMYGSIYGKNPIVPVRKAFMVGIGPERSQEGNVSLKANFSERFDI